MSAGGPSAGGPSAGGAAHGGDRGIVPDALREDYDGAPLDVATAAADPFAQFGQWFADAVSLPMANAMTLATVAPDGRPAARTVLLKGWDPRGFVFYTSYRSRKARELEAGGLAALLLWWQPLERQIRIEGRAERVSAAESDAYFATRPRASNLSAMASPQSAEVPDRGWLEARVVSLVDEWRGRDLVRPADWGGYRVVPEAFEFWQGRPDRLHDRVQYVREPGDPARWRRARLAP